MCCTFCNVARGGDRLGSGLAREERQLISVSGENAGEQAAAGRLGEDGGVLSVLQDSSSSGEASSGRL